MTIQLELQAQDSKLWSRLRAGKGTVHCPLHQEERKISPGFFRLFCERCYVQNILYSFYPSFSLKLLFLLKCIYFVCSGGVHATVYTWKSEGNPRELVLSFYHMSSRDQIWYQAWWQVSLLSEPFLQPYPFTIPFQDIVTLVTMVYIIRHNMAYNV